MNKHIVVALPVAVLLVACGHQPPEDDPLKNTRKLVKEGHATLYNNGAFEIPSTTIKLIPAGPDATTLAYEMAGMRARQSFELSVQHAKEAANLTAKGLDKTRETAAAVTRGTQSIADSLRSTTKAGAAGVAVAPRVAGEVTGAGADIAVSTARKLERTGESLSRDAVTSGGAIQKGTSGAAQDIYRKSTDLAARTYRESSESAGKHARWASEKFVKGYAALPENIGKRAQAVGDAASFSNFVKAMERSNEWRSEASGTFSTLVVDATGNYKKDVSNAFNKAGEELSRGRDSGYTLAALKSMRWVLQGVFWDGLVKPAGKLAAGSIGYVATNAVAYPVVVVVNQGVAVTNVAVQVVWNTAASAYDVTAPTAVAAVAGLFSAVEVIGGTAVAGATAVGGTVAAGATGIGGNVAAGTVAAGGYVAGKGVQYVGAPMAAIGVGTASLAVGVVAGAGTAAVGAGAAVVGAGGETVTQVAGLGTAGAVMVGGTTASVVAGGALGAYELTKAVVVPAGYELGAGLVLSYGTVTQLGAQAVLAVADASYLVLSLEGPTWVVYAVRGDLNKGDNLSTGTILDLEAMQTAGETFVRVPVSEEEMKRVVESVHGELPVVASPAEKQP